MSFYIDKHHLTIRALKELSPRLQYTISNKLDSNGSVLNEIDWDTFIISENQDSDGIFIPSIDEINNQIEIIIQGRDLELIRYKRDKLLAETDWWASNDLTMSNERSEYRQALRDMPQLYNTFDSAELNWPIKPK